MKQDVIQLCELALDGKISLDEFYDKWPVDANNRKLFKEIHFDLEDGIEHLPGKWFTDEIDWVFWKKTNMYWTIYIDSKILGSQLNYDEMYILRNILLKELPNCHMKKFIKFEADGLLSLYLNK